MDTRVGYSPAPVGRATVADRVAGRLVDAGVRTAFGVHGANIEDVFDAALRHPRLRPVVAKHEFGAGAMADCAAFVHLIEIAGALLRAGGGRKALIGLAQNSAGQIFTQEQVRVKAQAAIPGDGAAVATLTLGDAGNPVLGTETRSFGEFSADMTAVARPERKYWEAGPGQIHVGFTEAKIAKVLARGNRMVPEVAAALAHRIGIRPADLDLLVTNQPNRIFLRNWREAMELPESRHPDTFDECGNLFAVGIPMTLDAAIDDGRVGPGDVVMMSAFAHAGDFAAAGAIRWNGRS